MINIPNILTLLNLICGSIAVYCTLTGEYDAVLILFGLSLLFDFLDGFVARILNQTSEIGKQLDSLADLISFGLLPTILLVDLISTHIDMIQSPIYLFVFLLVGGAGLRLAKFNTIIESKSGFIGMPTPAMAWMVMGIWLNIKSDIFSNMDFINQPYFPLFTAVLLAILMNVSLPFLKFTISPLNKPSTLKSFLLIAVFIGLIFFNWRWACLASGLLYVLISLLWKDPVTEK